ncbi:MAG: Flp pilus assembly protein CpaB [Sphingomonadales bacterium]|jgi:pilus assembly protein CpaB
MDVRKLILVIVAIAIAGIAALLARSMVNTNQPVAAEVVQVEAPRAPSTEIMVAAVPLPLGKLVEEKDVAWKAWPEDGVDQNYILKENFDTTNLIGKVVRHSMVEGEPVTLRKLVGPGQRGFLAAVLGPGMRAVTVPVNQTTGIAGFIFPGDRVDLILTHLVKDARNQERQASETVLYNVRVLAVDRDTNDLNNAPKVASTVTLEVTPKIAEVISVLRKLGDLSLSLRSLASTESEAEGPIVNADFFAKRPSYTWDADVSALLPDVGTRNTLKVSRGAETKSVSTGGQ